jgi:hypothetical protein
MRMYLHLEWEESRALSELARREKRDMRQQAAHMLREELKRRGLLQTREGAILESAVEPQEVRS